MPSLEELIVAMPAASFAWISMDRADLVEVQLELVALQQVDAVEGRVVRQLVELGTQLVELRDQVLRTSLPPIEVLGAAVDDGRPLAPATVSSSVERFSMRSLPLSFEALTLRRGWCCR